MLVKLTYPSEPAYPSNPSSSQRSPRPQRSVWKISASALGRQFVECENREKGRDADVGKPTPPPEVTKEKVEAVIREGFVPQLFIDELDKIKTDSNFQAGKFSDVIDVIQSNGGQVVISSNLSDKGLRSAIGEQW